MDAFERHIFCWFCRPSSQLARISDWLCFFFCCVSLFKKRFPTYSTAKGVIVITLKPTANIQRIIQFQVQLFGLKKANNNVYVYERCYTQSMPMDLYSMWFMYYYVFRSTLKIHINLESPWKFSHFSVRHFSLTLLLATCLTKQLCAYDNWNCTSQSNLFAIKDFNLD